MELHRERRSNNRASGHGDSSFWHGVLSHCSPELSELCSRHERQSHHTHERHNVHRSNKLHASINAIGQQLHVHRCFWQSANCCRHHHAVHCLLRNVDRTVFQ